MTTAGTTGLARWATRAFVLLVACVTFGEMTDLAYGDVAGHGTHAETTVDADAGTRRGATELRLLVVLPETIAQPAEAVVREPEPFVEPAQAAPPVAERPPGLRLARDGIPSV